MSSSATASRTAAGFISLVLVAACAAEADEVSAESPLAMWQPKDSSSGISDLGNVRQLVLEGSCLALLKPDGTVATIVWPEGRATWNSDSQTVTLKRPGGEPLVAVVGEEVTLAGGVSDSANVRWATRPAEDCAKSYLVTG